MKIKQKKIFHTYKDTKSIIVLGPMKIKKSHKNKILQNKHSLILLLDGASGDFISKDLSFLSFGDGDSSLEGPDFLKLNQDISDLAFLLSHLGSLEYLEELTFYGMSGGRMDHYLSNMGEILNFMNQRKLKKWQEVQITLDEEIFFLNPGLNHFSFKAGFSLLSFEQNALKITGNVLYPLNKWQKTSRLSSHTLSNKACGAFAVEAKKPFLLIKY